MAERKQAPDGAYSLSNLKVTTRYLDPDYDIDVHDLTRGDTGLLKAFSLRPRIAQKASFRARIDDGNPGKRKPPELDIDIQGVAPAIDRDFKGKRNGYAGHHTDRSPSPQERIFEVKIVVPSGKVFEGDVFFNVHFKMVLEAAIYSVVGVSTTVTRAVPEKPAPNWLERANARLLRMVLAVLKFLHIS